MNFSVTNGECMFKYDRISKNVVTFATVLVTMYSRGTYLSTECPFQHPSSDSAEAMIPLVHNPLDKLWYNIRELSKLSTNVSNLISNGTLGLGAIGILSEGCWMAKSLFCAGAGLLLSGSVLHRLDTCERVFDISLSNKNKIQEHIDCPVPQPGSIFFWGVREPQNEDLLVPKSGLFGPHPLNPSKTPCWTYFVS